jgi:hypothetical protein
MVILQRRPIEDDFEVATAIEMASLCRDLHVLPGPGGLLDQDSYHIWLIQAALAVFNEKEHREIEAEKAKAKTPRRR